MVTKSKKQEIVAELIEQISNANSFFFIDFAGMPVKQQEVMRNELKAKNTTMRVAKKYSYQKSI